MDCDSDLINEIAPDVLSRQLLPVLHDGLLGLSHT
jgi:hypothetical protein